MSRYNRYGGDPHWIDCRYPGKCAGCGQAIRQGSRAFRYKSGALYGAACGCGHTREDEFLAAAADERAYAGESGGMSW